jgi:dCMP deaminase
MADTRPSFDEWALGIAKAVSTRGECTRRQIGAIILDGDHHIVGQGYNGAAPGEPSCLEGACPRGRHYCLPPGSGGSTYSSAAWCACGHQWPCPHSAEPDSIYDTGIGSCIGRHAEFNAMLDAGLARLGLACTIYISDKPCPGCQKLLRGCVSRVVWPDGELRF